MKKTLNNLFSFSLFALLSSFSIFANSATFNTTSYWQLYNKSNCSILSGYTATTAQLACNSSGSTTTVSVRDTPNPAHCTHIPYGQCVQTNGVNTFNVYRVSSCPANSTLSGSTCTPNAGFSAVNTDPSANGGSGSWSVVATGSECTSQPNTTYNTTNGLCEVSQVEPSAGILSSAYGVAAVGAGVIIGGISILMGSSILAAGGLALAVHGALFATTGLSSSYAPQSPQEAVNATKPPLTVIVNPNSAEKQQIPNDGGTPTIIRDTDTKTFKPGGGATGSWQQGATGGWEYGVKIPPSTVRIPRATISPDGKQVDLDSPQDNQHTVPVRTHIKNFDDNSMLVGWGANLPTTDSNNQPTYLPTARLDSFDSTGKPTGGETYVSPKNTNGTDSNFTANTPISANPPPSSTGVGSGSCGSFACESTALQSLEQLKQINADLKVTPEQSASIFSDFNVLGESVDSQMADLITQFNGSGYHDALQSAFGSILPVSPFEKIYSSANQSCVFNFTLFNHEYHLSMCEALPFLHPALAFILQFALAIFVLNLIFERPKG
ncbi:MAG: hypothetical protein ACO1N8_11340 [Methylophilus sp.]